MLIYYLKYKNKIFTKEKCQVNYFDLIKNNYNLLLIRKNFKKILRENMKKKTATC